jgi:hypothetical protein
MMSLHLLKSYFKTALSYKRMVKKVMVGRSFFVPDLTKFSNSVERELCMLQHPFKSGILFFLRLYLS